MDASGCGLYGQAGGPAVGEAVHCCVFFNDTATPEIYTLSLHDALPISLVRAGLVDRQPDPNNRRRLALTLTEAGRQRLHSPPASDASLEGRISKLAHSEIRALERGFEILERLPR